MLKGLVPVGSPLLARQWKNSVYSAVAAQSGRSEASARWLNQAFSATDAPFYESLQPIRDSNFESSDCRLFEALSEKIATIPILQDSIELGQELETSRREAGIGGLSVLWLLRIVMDRIAPPGTESGERARNMEIIGKLKLDVANPLADLDSFLVRLSRAKSTCLQGTTEPSVVQIIEGQLFTKLKTELEARNVPRLGTSLTFYEFGYSAFLMTSDDASEQTFQKLYHLVARWQQWKVTSGADKQRDQDSERTATGRGKTLRGTPATGQETGGSEGASRNRRRFSKENAQHSLPPRCHRCLR